MARDGAHSEMILARSGSLISDSARCLVDCEQKLELSFDHLVLALTEMLTNLRTSLQINELEFCSSITRKPLRQHEAPINSMAPVCGLERKILELVATYGPRCRRKHRPYLTVTSSITNLSPSQALSSSHLFSAQGGPGLLFLPPLSRPVFLFPCFHRGR